MTTEIDYFQDPKGDIWFISTDGQIFQVSTVFLSYASEVFADMLAIGSPSSKGEGSLNHPLPIDVDAKTFDAILRYIYPVKKPEFTGNDGLLPLQECLAFSHKFVMSGVMDMLRSHLLRLDVLKNEPLEPYYLSCLYNLREEMKKTAMVTLTISLSDHRQSKLLDMISGRDFYRLTRLHALVQEQVENVLKKPFPAKVTTSVGLEPWWKEHPCICCPKITFNTVPPPKDSPPRWSAIYLESALHQVYKDWKSVASYEIFKPNFIQACADRSDCHNCRVNWKGFQNHFTKLEEKVKQILCHKAEKIWE
jgi:hypothetical protein